jgi:hypothetical protein
MRADVAIPQVTATNLSNSCAIKSITLIGPRSSSIAPSTIQRTDSLFKSRFA